MNLKDLVKANKKENKDSQNNFKLDLDLQETSIILKAMKEASFNGKDLEKVFNLALKLQKHYTKLEKND